MSNDTDFSATSLSALPLATALLDEDLCALRANERFRALVGAFHRHEPLLERLVSVEGASVDEGDAGIGPLAAALRELAPGAVLARSARLRDARDEAVAVRLSFCRASVAAGPGAAALVVQLESQEGALAGQSATVAQPLAWYRTLFLESVLPKLLLDEAHRIVDANDAARELLGRELPALLWQEPGALLADDAARARLARERAAGEALGDPVQETLALPVMAGNGRTLLLDAVTVSDLSGPGAALRVVTLLTHFGESDDEQGARWHERFLASVRDEVRMLPTRSIGAALVEGGRLTRMSASFAGFFELSAGASTPLAAVVGARTAQALERAARALDEDAREPYRSLPVVEFVWSSTSGRPASFVAMARPAGDADTVLLTVVDTTGRDLDVARRLEALAVSRDALLRQVHAQVGANLAWMADLVRAEARWNPESAALLERLAGRLATAAHVEGLSPEDYSKQVQPAARIVADIVASLSERYQVPIDFEGPAADAPTRRIARNDRLALALVINELVTNAIRRRTDPARPVRVSVRVQGQEVAITVRNAGTLRAPAAPTPGTPTPGTPTSGTPASGTPASGTPASGTPTPPPGQAFLERLLPTRGARFSLSQEGDEVVGCVRLTPPAIY